MAMLFTKFTRAVYRGLIYFINVYVRLPQLLSITAPLFSSSTNLNFKVTNPGSLLQRPDELVKRGKYVDDLFAVIPQCIQAIFPQVQYCHVYLDLGGLKDADRRPFPSGPVARELIGYRELKQNLKLAVDTEEPVFNILSVSVSPHTLFQLGVSYLPVFNSLRGSPLAVILFVNEHIEVDEAKGCSIQTFNEALSEKIGIMQSQYHSSTLSLLAELSSIDDNISLGQLTVVQHLKRETGADVGFLLSYTPSDDDFVIKALDGKVIPEKRFPSSSLPVLQSHLNLSQPILTSCTSELKSNLTLIAGQPLHPEHCVLAPIKQSNKLIGILILLSGAPRFTQEHLDMIEAGLSLCGSMLYKDMVVERERTLRQQTEKLHHVAKNIFTHLDDLTILLKEIMQEARYLCHAERCSVFLLEAEANELVAKVFDGDIASNEEVRMSASEGIAGQVVQTGKILNIKDAYSHPLFYRGVDETTGFRTKSILCFPIKDEKDKIIGAAQLCNKIGSPHFNSTDEVIAKALATYCCISIVNSIMYRDVLDAHNRVKLANELMVFHMLVPSQDVVELMKQKIIPLAEFGKELHLQDFKNSLPRYVPINTMPMAVMSMMTELEFCKNFKIKSQTLARFVLMVRKGYRDPPYHNWNHAFSVAHFAYLILRNIRCVAEGVLDELEALAFFVAALCHDIDHRGTSNSFQVASNSVLAALYSSEGSVMERHHFSQTLCILNTEGCNIFENVTRKEYEQLLDLIRDIILSTDIAHHLRIRGGLEAMAEEGFNKTNPEHKSLLLCLVMTSADLSDQTKPWTAAKRVSKMLYKEFFSQGDLEKALGRNPMEMMDRERASIPDLQIGFIDHIVLPAFRTLRTVFPTTGCLVTNIEENREHWVTIKTKTADRRDSLTSLEVFDFIDEEDERESSGEDIPSA